MAFVDDVLSRKASFAKLEDSAARAMHDTLQSMLGEAQAKLSTLSDSTDKDGNLVDNAPGRARVQRIIAEINDALADTFLQATDTLIDARKTAYEKGAVDLQYATEKATGNDFGGSTEQLFRGAAKVAATKPVLMDPTNSKKSVKPSEAFDGVQAWTEDQVKAILSGAILRGQSIPHAAKKLQEAGDVTKRAATRIVRTNVNAAMNDAHDDFYTQNPDVFSGRRWSAVRDSRTSTICAGLDGRFYTLQESPPGPPAHPNCRCSLIGVLKDDEMESDVRKQTQRVKDTTTNEYKEARRDEEFSKWLKEQPESKTKKITGSAVKDELFRTGALNLDELVKPNLVTRTDKEAVELALAKDPANPKLEALRAKVNALRKSLGEVNVDDAFIRAKQKFDEGQDGGRVDAARERRLKAQADLQKAEADAKANVPPPKPKPGDVNYTPKNADQAIEHLVKYDDTRAQRIEDRKALQAKIDTHIEDMQKVPFGPEFDKLNADLTAMQARRDDLNRGMGEEGERVLKQGPRSRLRPDVKDIDPIYLSKGSVPTKKQLKAAKDALEWASSFVSKKWKGGRDDPTTGKPTQDVYFEFSTRRANHDQFSVNGWGRIMGDGTDKSTMAHEWAHHLEAFNPLIHQRCVEFFEARTKGETLQKLNKLVPGSTYKDDEVAKPDKFHDPYVGRYYASPEDINARGYRESDPAKVVYKKGEPYGTEILSMGVERMLRSASEFARNDPEYFKLVYEIMKGTLK